MDLKVKASERSKSHYDLALATKWQRVVSDSAIPETIACQARILELGAISFCRGSSWPRDWTQVSCIAGKFFTYWATREAPWSGIIPWLLIHEEPFWACITSPLCQKRGEWRSLNLFLKQGFTSLFPCSDYYLKVFTRDKHWLFTLFLLLIPFWRANRRLTVNVSTGAHLTLVSGNANPEASCKCLTWSPSISCISSSGHFQAQRKRHPSECDSTPTATKGPNDTAWKWGGVYAHRVYLNHSRPGILPAMDQPEAQLLGMPCQSYPMSPRNLSSFIVKLWPTP